MNIKTVSLFWWYRVIAPIALLIVTAIMYYPSLTYEFQFDDLASITKHFNIRHYSLSQLFFSGTRWISYWLNSIYYKIGKFDPFAYRLGNVIIHCINGLLVFCILSFALSRLKKDSFFKRNAYGIALLTMLLFLLHPVQTQTVSYVIQGQLEGLAALFSLSMVLFFLHSAYAQTIRKSIGFLSLLFICTIGACGTKEIAIIAPLLIALVDWFFVAQGSWQSFKKRLWIHGALCILMIGIYTYLLKPEFFTNILGLKITARNNIGNVITTTPNDIITPYQFFISQFKVVLHYLWIFLWPIAISVEYDWKLSESFAAPDCIAPFLILVAIGISIALLLRKNSAHVIGFGALWFAICMAPRSSIIPSPELLVDYKTYLASFGWLFLLACALVKSIEWIAIRYKQVQPSLSYAPLLLLASTLCFLTVQRNKVWHSGLEFWEDIIKHAPGKARAYNNYGVELSQKLHQYVESIPYFKKAITMDRFYPDPCNNLAVAYASLGKNDEAIEALKQGLRINPFYPEGYNNIASFLILKKEYAQAKQALQTAIRLRPYYGKAYLNMGRIYLDLGEHEKAWEYFRKCCMEADLDNEIGFGSFGKVSLLVKKYDDAIFAYRKVLEITPNDVEAIFNLGNAYFLSSRYKEACNIYEQLYKIAPHDLRVWYNLAETYYAIEQYEKCIYFFEKVHDAGHHPPQSYARLIACHAQLGKLDKAKQLLHALKMIAIPDKDKDFMEKALKELKEKYKIA